MSDTTNLKRSVQSLERQPVYDGYSKIVIQVSDDVEYTAGTDSGRTLTLNCPWGNQEMAERILSRVKGFQYQPYTASGAYLDPAAELGDGVTIGNVYSGIFSKKVHHGPLYIADISAPGGEKINYQNPYKSPQERIVSRKFREVRASLSIQADKIAAEVEERQNQYGLLRATLNIQAKEIEAKVSKEGGNSSSFGWKLTATGWSVYGNGSEIFWVDKTGAYVKGEIRASSGKIGGFDIKSNYLSYNGQTWGGTNTTGAYIGQSGIQIGKNFKVDMQGNLTATSGKFGSLSVNSSGNTIGTYSGSLSGCDGSVRGLSGSVSGLSGSVKDMSGSLSTDINVGNKSIGTYVGDIVAGKITANYINAKLAQAEFVGCKALRNRDNTYSPMLINYINWQGEKKSVRVFGC